MTSHRCVVSTTGECGRSVCGDEPCMHGGTCVPDNNDATHFTCLCADEYSGMFHQYLCAPLVVSLIILRSNILKLFYFKAFLSRDAIAKRNTSYCG